MSLPTYRTKCKDRARRRQEGGKAQFGCASLSINGGNLWRFRFVPCCAHLLSRGWLFATPWTVARQAPLSMGILQVRILEWATHSCPPPGDLPNSRVKPRSPTFQVDSLPSQPPIRFVESRKKEGWINSWCFLLLNHSLNLFGAMAESVHRKKFPETNPSLKCWMKGKHQELWHQNITACSCYHGALPTLGSRCSGRGRAGMGVLCWAPSICPVSDPPLLLSRMSVCPVSLAARSWVSSHLGQNLSLVKLLGLGRFSAQLNITSLCILDKYSLFSWTSLCFYNLSANMIFIRMCSISKRFLAEWSVLATVVI